MHDENMDFGLNMVKPVSNSLSRRKTVANLITASLLAVGVFGGSYPARAASEKVWGAAELDFLMYICGATGKFCPAKTKVTVEPARTVDATFASAVAAFPGSVLVQNFGIPAGKLTSAVEEESKFYLAEFQKRIIFDPQDLSNQYSFDFNAYLTYLAIAKLLPDPGKQAQFQKKLGDKVLGALAERGAKIEVVDARRGQRELDTVVQGCKSILETFAAINFISKFSVDTSDIDASYFSPDGPPTSFSFTFDAPATLQAMLQMSGEGTRFKPDYVGIALGSYFAQCSIAADYASYFVDTQYRPNPDDYQPTQVLAQFNLRPLR